MTRRPRQIIGPAVAATALVLAGCSDRDEPDAAEAATTTEPAITAPPTTPEEQAEAEIIATFETLIAARDEYYSNASDYSIEDVSTNSPATEWSVTGGAQLDLSNWTVLWREGGFEQRGVVHIAAHQISGVQFAPSGDAADRATSVACLDLASLKYVTFDGTPAELSYEPDQYQTWDMTWIHYPEAASEAGVDEAGWYVQTIDVARNKTC